MFDKDAIDALTKAEAISAAQVCTQAAIDAHGPVPLPHDFQLHDTEKYLPRRRRARGAMATSVLADFAAYTKTHAETGATVFVSPDHMNATAVLNLGTYDTPGHADNTATLTLKRTAAFVALGQVAGGQGHKQATIAEFLEDWAGNVKCFNDAEDIAPPKAIAAIRKITIEAMRKLESAEQQLSATRSAFEHVQATSGPEPLPTLIYFTCEPYQGLQARTFILRLAVLTGNDEPAITLRVVKAEEHQEEMAAELASRVTEALADTSVPVHLGSYQAKA